mmetsp:Transcript_4317/g.10418  ORF Transcript_4317/g.10418 Transcript_4317/m.10418 type:complete len:359 (-) Transcript_4317:289-1365(-)
MTELVSRLLDEVVNATKSEDPDVDDDNSIDSGIFAKTVTPAETWMDIVFGTLFLVTAVFAAKRMSWTRQNSGAETTVVTAFYSLIFVTSILRAIWFLIPATVWTPSYTPVAIYAFDTDHPAWLGAFFSEFVLTMGSLSLFSIFILILVYWADILKKYFHPASRRAIPMVVFLAWVSFLVVLEIGNIAAFFFQLYTTEGMILFNSFLLAIVSFVCVYQITVFSHRFKTVLKTLGAINQVSTESQVTRIVWITMTGNLFFFTRAFLESIFCFYLYVYWKEEHTVARSFSHPFWDKFVGVKFFSELVILSLMLYILQSRFSGGSSSSVTTTSSDSDSRPTGYVTVPNAEAAATDGVQAMTV